MRISVATIGCKVNQYESRSLEEALAARGHVLVPLGEDADAVVVNSCTVTHRADRDVRRLVRRVRTANPDARVVVTGCYAQTDAPSLRRLGVDLVVGSAEKAALPELLDQGAAGTHVSDVAGLRTLAPQPVHRFDGRARAYLKVQDGCEAFCAYCIVPHARGPSRSLPLQEVRRGLERMRSAGHGEVVLTGVHLGLWGRDLRPAAGFAALLDAAEAAGIPRVRLSSLEPAELTPETLRRVGASAVLCPHLHVPLQSGSDRILAAMGRPYTAAEFAARIEGALEAVPGVCLGFDVIVGFPGEDDAAFAATENLLAAIPFGYLHVFPFSPRRGTAAYGLPDRVPGAVVKERAQRLRRLAETKGRQFRLAHLGRVLQALPETPVGEALVRLRTRNYIPVQVPAAQVQGAVEIPVRLDRLAGAVVEGSVVGCRAEGG